MAAHERGSLRKDRRVEGRSLDVTLPGLNSLELQGLLTERTEMPITFITGHGTRADERAGHEGGSRRVPDEAVQEGCSVGCYPLCSG